MNAKPTLAAVILTFLCAIAPVYGEGESDYSSRFLSTSEGLPHSNVDGLFRDHLGFVWISFFGGGVARYDGSQILSFHATQPTQHLKSNYVTESCEDKFGRIWIAETSGIDILSQKDFTLMELPAQIAKTANGRHCNFITTDHEDNLWYSTDRSLYRVAFRGDGSIERLDSLDCGSESGSLRLKFRDLDQDGSVWTSLEGYIYRVRFVEGKGLIKSPALPRLFLGDGNKASDLLKNGNEIWIGSNDGLFRYDLITGTIKEYRYSPAKGSLSSNQITELAVSTDNRVLIGTIKGLNIYNPVTDSFICLNSNTDANGDKALADDIVRSLEVIGDQIWVGSELEGITILNSKKLQITNIQHLGNDARSLPESPVSALHIDALGNKWIGTLKQGLYFTDGDLHNYKSFNIGNSKLHHNSVTALEEDNHGRLWIGEREGGLNMINIHRPDIISDVPIINSTPNNRIDNINELKYDSFNDLLWICSRSGLYTYSVETKRLELFEPGKRMQFFTSCIDSSGDLWFGCQQGLLCINPRTMNSRLISGIGPCFAVSIDNDGHLWTGSFGNGIYRSNTPVKPEEEPEFTLFSTKDGLANNKVRSSVVSGQYLWVGTDDGLSRIDTSNGTILSFSTDDGLKSMVFSNNAAYASDTGEVYFGHKKGFSVISSNEIKQKSQDATRLSFTEATVGEHLINLSYENTIRLHESDKSFTFEFADLSFDSYGKSYFYRLLPIDASWSEVKSTNKHVRYECLSGGKYKLQIKAEDSRGNCLATDEREVIVTPFFYKTWWFALSIIILIAGYIVFAFKRRTQQIVRQRTILQQEVAKQTKLLTEQKKELEKKAQELLEQNKTLLRLNEDLAGNKMIIDLGQESTTKDRDTAFMDRLMTKIKSLYKDPDISVDTLCKEMGMSRSVLNDKIQNAFGQPTGQFIRTYRLNIAKQILTQGTGGMNVSEVAYEVGFNDPKYFTRCFTKEFGIAPSAVKRKREE